MGLRGRSAGVAVCHCPGGSVPAPVVMSSEVSALSLGGGSLSFSPSCISHTAGLLGCGIIVDLYLVEFLFVLHFIYL